MFLVLALTAFGVASNTSLDVQPQSSVQHQPAGSSQGQVLVVIGSLRQCDPHTVPSRQQLRRVAASVTKNSQGNAEVAAAVLISASATIKVGCTYQLQQQNAAAGSYSQGNQGSWVPGPYRASDQLEVSGVDALACLTGTSDTVTDQGPGHIFVLQKRLGDTAGV